jgi:VWFA-related protein
MVNSRLDLFLLVPLLCAPQVSARQNNPSTQPRDGRIYLDVVVTPKSGPPVRALQQQDFTILDNKKPQTIRSFEVVDGRLAPIEVAIVLDAVNTGSREVAIAREELSSFLKAGQGRLPYPTTVAILTDKGLQFQEDFSQDRNAIITALDHYTIPIRSIGPATDRGGITERFQISFQGFAQLIAQERDRPGRKLIVWVSPGWPPLFGLETMRDAKLLQQLFGNIVDLSTQLREGQTTLYTVDPSGIALADTRWEDYLKGVRKPGDIQMGTLAVQVIAIQSGGLVLSSSNIPAQLQKCIADAATYYEISFDPAISDQPNQYHQLEIRVAKPGLTARTRQGYYSQPERARELTAKSKKPGNAEGEAPPQKFNALSSAPSDSSDQIDYANAHLYMDLPLAQLIERIPELKNLQPAPDQQELPVILQKMGRSVDDFVREIGDLIAHEDVTQEKLNAKGDIKAKERVQDNYLILHHGYAWGASAEYRMDDKGNRLGPTGLEKGYLVTSGHALSCISFSTVAQPQSRFRYLGEEKIDSRETYVLGFAQQPGEATFFTTMRGTGGTDVDMLTQGILWVDKNGFQIVRMRSDLLASHHEIQLDQLTTEVTFGEVQLQDVQNSLWLPRDVDVYIEIDKQRFRNLHHYTDYRRYRVAVKIGGPQ